VFTGISIEWLCIVFNVSPVWIIEEWK